MSKQKKLAKGPVNPTPELLNNEPEALPTEFVQGEEFIKRNGRILGYGVLAIVLVVVGYFVYRYYQNNQEQAAQEQLFAAQQYFQNDSLRLATKGDGKYRGAEAVAKDYAGTKAGALANFYIGVAHLKNGKYNEAIAALKKFDAGDRLVQARAYALIGDAYTEQSKFADAAGYYRKAADWQPNAQFTPMYLMKLALALEKQNKNAEAIAVYDDVISRYYNSAEATNAKKYKARLETLSGK